MWILVGLLSVLIGGCAPAAPQRSEPGGGDLAAEQVFRFAATEPTTIDPGLTGDFTTLQYFQLLGEGLVGYDQAGKIRMLGAESYEVSSDGMVFTFKLRPEAKFSDGSPVTARDYEWTMKRNLDPASGSKYAQSLYPITGAQAFNRGDVADRDAVGVTAVDDHTLRITTASPAAYFLSLAATSWTMFPLKRDVLERYGEKWTEAEHYVGNGPFTIQSWKHDQEMVLVPNPHYWGARPVLQQVVIKLMADPAGQSQVSYEKGELDFANVPSTDVERVQRDPVLSKETKRVAISADRWVSFDNANPPFRDVRVRKAFYLAIDREALANVIFRGVPVPAWTVLPPTVDGHNPGARIPGGPDDARRLLAEAGYPEGQGLAEVELVGPTQTEFRLIAQGLQQMWKTVLGVSTKINLMEPNTFVNWRRARKEQPYQAYIGGWANDYNDPYNWHNFLFDSKSDYYNLHYANPTFDELVARGAGELDTARRKQLYEQAEALFVGEAPVAPLYYRAYLVAVKPYVDGLVYTPDLGMLRLDWTRILAH